MSKSRKPTTIAGQWSIPPIGRFRIREVVKGRDYSYVVEFQSFEIRYGTGRWIRYGIETETESGAAWELLNRLDVGHV